MVTVREEYSRRPSLRASMSVYRDVYGAESQGVSAPAQAGRCVAAPGPFCPADSFVELVLESAQLALHLSQLGDKIDPLGPIRTAEAIRGRR